MLTIGIDPGLYGAIGMLENGEFVAVSDMPITLKGYGSVTYEVDPAGLKRLLLSKSPPESDTDIFLERVNAMPGMAVGTMFSLGDSFGVCRAVVASCGFKIEIRSPQSWKKHFNISANKEEARALAIRMFPSAELHLKKHADRAESLLMAKFLWNTKYK